MGDFYAHYGVIRPFFGGLSRANAGYIPTMIHRCFLFCCLLVLCATSSIARAAYVFSDPVNFHNQDALFSFGLGSGTVIPQTDAVYGLVQSTLLDHIQVAYQYGMDYALPTTGIAGGAFARIQAESLGYHYFFGNYGVYGGVHLEQTAPGSSVPYTYGNTSYNLYGLLRLAPDTAAAPVAGLLGKDTVVYLGFRRTVFDTFRYRTGDNSIFQMVAGTHAAGDDVAWGLGNFYSEITVEMSDFGAGSADNVFGLNLGFTFDMFGPTSTEKAQRLAAKVTPL